MFPLRPLRMILCYSIYFEIYLPLCKIYNMRQVERNHHTFPILITNLDNFKIKRLLLFIDKEQ